MINLFSQKIEFTYDENGNRLSRMTLTVEQLRSNTVKFPVYNPVNLKSVENAKAMGIEDAAKNSTGIEEGEMITLVYPNPNKGLIKIDISNIPLESNNEMRLYDLSGMELKVKRNFDSYSEIDISQLKDGIYILRIKINNTITDWKIVKSH